MPGARHHQPPRPPRERWGGGGPTEAEADADRFGAERRGEGRRSIPSIIRPFGVGQKDSVPAQRKSVWGGGGTFWPLVWSGPARDDRGEKEECAGPLRLALHTTGEERSAKTIAKTVTLVRFVDERANEAANETANGDGQREPEREIQTHTHTYLERRVAGSFIIIASVMAPNSAK